MNCSICNKAIKINSTVQKDTETGAIACSDRCKKAYESKLEQGDFAVPWAEFKYQQVMFEAQGAKLVKTMVDMKGNTPVIMVQVNLPSGVSVDDIKTFCGQVVSVTFAKVELVWGVIEAEEKA